MVIAFYVKISYYSTHINYEWLITIEPYRAALITKIISISREKVVAPALGNIIIRTTGRFFYALYQGIDQDDLIGQATKVSYTALFSLIPLLIIIITMLTMFGLDANLINELLSVWTETLPPEIHEFVSGIVQRILTSPPSGLFSASILIIIWTSTTAFSEIFFGLNRIANTKESRSFLKRRLLALILVLCVGLSGGISLFLMTVGIKTFHFFGIYDFKPLAVFKYRLPISITFLFVAAVILYTIAPAFRPKFLYTLPGAVFFALTAIGMTMLIQKGVIKFVYSNALYGALGSGLLLMTWFYLVSFILLLGAEINAVLERMRGIYYGN